MEIVWRFLIKLKIELPYNHAIILLGIYLEKNIIQKNTCTQVFIAALFTKVKSWKQPKCPSTEEWIKMMWCMYTVEYYSVLEKKAILSHAKTWITLKILCQVK